MGGPSHRQDYMARIRYSNTLPPPPCPPKLLQIPNTGLSSGQYTSVGFASRLAREQPLNIEADAELGMPIDLVGIPGIFEGDERAISALDRDRKPRLTGVDLELMRHPRDLGKQTRGAKDVSFLRKTEYTTAHTGGSRSTFESSNSSNTILMKAKRRRRDVNQEDPINILRHVQKSFDIAYPADAYTGPETDGKVRAAQISPEEKQAWRNPKHPKKNVTLLDSYPLLPDWDAITDFGGYMLYKFTAPPVQDSSGVYDERLDVAIIRPAGETVEDREMYLAEMAAYKEDPTKPEPMPRSHYELYLPPDSDNIHEKVRGMKRNFTTHDPDNIDDAFFDESTANDDDGSKRKCFKFENVRTYETAGQSGSFANPYNESVALALHDPESHKEENKLRDQELQKAAYFYPIGPRVQLRPKRPGDTQMVGEQVEVHFAELITRWPNEAETEKRAANKAKYDAAV